MVFTPRLSILLLIYGLFVLALLVAEYRQDRRAQIFFKPLAALGFILLALSVGALESDYGRIILGGLIACAAGDVFLLSRNSEKLFICGMAGFAIGHIAYLIGFFKLGLNSPSVMMFLGSLLPILTGIVFYRWLRPKLASTMRLPVAIYSLIIVAMVIKSLSVPLSGVMALAPLAAIMFAVSDMFVARDRFVTPEPRNALAITPLYFGAQALFALSASI